MWFTIVGRRLDGPVKIRIALGYNRVIKVAASYEVFAIEAFPIYSMIMINTCLFSTILQRWVMHLIWKARTIGTNIAPMAVQMKFSIDPNIRRYPRVFRQTLPRRSQLVLSYAPRDLIESRATKPLWDSTASKIAISKGWTTGRIVPFSPLTLQTQIPPSPVFHAFTLSTVDDMADVRSAVHSPLGSTETDGISGNLKL